MIIHRNNNFILVQPSGETTMSRQLWHSEVEKALSMKNKILEENGGYSLKMLKHPQYMLWTTYYSQLTDRD